MSIIYYIMYFIHELNLSEYILTWKRAAPRHGQMCRYLLQPFGFRAYPNAGGIHLFLAVMSRIHPATSCLYLSR